MFKKKCSVSLFSLKFLLLFSISVVLFQYSLLQEAEKTKPQ